MNGVTKWAYRLGLLAGVLALLGGFPLWVADIVAPQGTMGDRTAPEALVRVFILVFMLLGFVVFLGAIRELRATWEPFDTVTRVAIMGALVATSFFGGYIFFWLYPRLRMRFKV